MVRRLFPRVFVALLPCAHVDAVPFGNYLVLLAREMSKGELLPSERLNALQVLIYPKPLSSP